MLCQFRTGIIPCLGTYLKLVCGSGALLGPVQMPGNAFHVRASLLSPSASKVIQTFITLKFSNYEESPILFFSVLSYLLSISKFLR